jgi:hypothetical protein
LHIQTSYKCSATQIIAPLFVCTVPLLAFHMPPAVAQVTQQESNMEQTLHATIGMQSLLVQQAQTFEALEKYGRDLTKVRLLPTD